jgi:thiosulfate reductase cytochrome b subunit
MATFGSSVRRGLPRTPGGEPWPPAGTAPVGSEASATPEASVVAEVPAAREVSAAADVPVVERARNERDETPAPAGSSARADVPVAAAPIVAAAPAAARPVRRGLPRVPGGEQWPPASTIPAGVTATAASTAPTQPEAPLPAPIAVTEGAATVATKAVTAPQASPSAPGATDGKPLRRGLPRTPGGEPWPPEGLAPSAAPVAPVAAGGTAAAQVAEVTAVAAAPAASAAPQAEVAASTSPVVAATPSGVPLSQPLPYPHTVWEGANARVHPVARREPRKIGPLTGRQWGLAVLGGAALLYAAAMVVLAVRWLLSTSWGVSFLAAFPGEYHLPEGAPVGFPAWLGWQHFFNVFLMVLIIRTGLTVRTEKRPTVFWSPRSNGRRKISLNLWFHQSLDILWLVNGVIFVVLLFVTGQWLRIVPTSWEVFPNALSAALQYASLDWPTENGWVNYNSLQQLAYFTTVFIAAPLAAITGVRMSGVWPKNAAGLNKAYPVEWARAVHFPVMLYFVLFIFVHVVLVFATGALRNLNHMYAMQGSTDPDAYADNWVGFWLFALSLIVIVAAWIAARPLVLAPIARLFGKVSGR